MKHSAPPIDVFISYKREDRETAKALAEALAHRGYSVWWDVDLLPGERFADAIMEVIKRAEATIVLWSEASVPSSFVRAEASVADGLGRLIPARLDTCELPLPFNVLHTHDLTRWRAGADETLLAPLFMAIEARTGKAPTAPQQPAAADNNLHRQDDEAELWRSISGQHEPSMEEYAYYLKTYPVGTFADLARMRLAKLQKPRPLKTTKNAIIALGSIAAAIAAIIGLLGPLAEYLPSAVRFVTDRSYQPGNRFNDCDDDGWCPEMVVVSAGTFLMGSPEDEDERDQDEGPQHLVTIAEPFAIGVYEVTFDEWDTCVADGGCDGHRPEDEGWGRGRRPVIDVSWHHAQAYVEWLSDRTGHEYRLPSEAEWEYAARAGTDTRFWSGEEIAPEYANFGVHVGKTIDVGFLRQPNGFGLHDVHGNVWEWVADCWNSSYAGVPDNGMAWTIGDCGRRVLRGGSWSNDPRDLRSANRGRIGAGGRDSGIGFRVARILR